MNKTCDFPYSTNVFRQILMIGYYQYMWFDTKINQTETQASEIDSRCHRQSLNGHWDIMLFPFSSIFAYIYMTKNCHFGRVWKLQLVFFEHYNDFLIAWWEIVSKEKRSDRWCFWFVNLIYLSHIPIAHQEQWLFYKLQHFSVPCGQQF